jgi:hypothetical protein
MAERSDRAARRARRRRLGGYAENLQKVEQALVDIAECEARAYHSPDWYTASATSTSTRRRKPLGRCLPRAAARAAGATARHERHTVDELHGDEGAPVGIAHLVDLGDVEVPHLGLQLRLAQQPRVLLGVARTQQLERDFTLEVREPGPRAPRSWLHARSARRSRSARLSPAG